MIVLSLSQYILKFEFIGPKNWQISSLFMSVAINRGQATTYAKFDLVCTRFCNRKKVFKGFLCLFWTYLNPILTHFRPFPTYIALKNYTNCGSSSTCWSWKLQKTSKTSKSVNQLNSNTFEKDFLRKKISDFHNFFKKKLILPKLWRFECS